jgi:hypothetical protein
MKTLLKLILVALTLQFVACSTPEITISRSTGEQVEIFPDYKDIIIPCNIAPMNFNVTGEGNHHLIISGSGEQLQVRAENGLFDIPIKEWRRMMDANVGGKLEFTVAREQNGEWLSYEPFTMEVSPDPIDSHLAYRLLPPAEQWLKIGIFQRIWRPSSRRPSSRTSSPTITASTATASPTAIPTR